MTPALPRWFFSPKLAGPALLVMGLLAGCGNEPGTRVWVYQCDEHNGPTCTAAQLKYFDEHRLGISADHQRVLVWAPPEAKVDRTDRRVLPLTSNCNIASPTLWTCDNDTDDSYTETSMRDGRWLFRHWESGESAPSMDLVGFTGIDYWLLRWGWTQPPKPADTGMNRPDPRERNVAEADGDGASNDGDAPDHGAAVPKKSPGTAPAKPESSAPKFFDKDASAPSKEESMSTEATA